MTTKKFQNATITPMLETITELKKHTIPVVSTFLKIEKTLKEQLAKTEEKKQAIVEKHAVRTETGDWKLKEGVTEIKTIYDIEYVNLELFRQEFEAFLLDFFEISYEPYNPETMVWHTEMKEKVTIDSILSTTLNGNLYAFVSYFSTENAE